MSDGGAAVIVSSDEETLRFTQGIRRQLVTEMIGGGKMPDDPRDKEILLKALTDMDRQAISNKRLRSEEGLSEAASTAAKALERISQTLGNENPFAAKGGTGRVIDMPATFIEVLETVPGEMAIGMDNRDYEQFEKDMQVGQA